MAYEMKELTGSTFKNTRKDNDKQPGYTGEALIGGVAYKMATWVNKDKNGNTYFSHKFEKKEQKPVESKPASDFNDDLDF